MNDILYSIEAAAKEHADQYFDTHTASWFQKYNEKFSELIIQECIATHVDHNGIDIIGTVLKEHFGITQ